MSELRIAVSMDGAAFEDGPATELGRILRNLAERIEGGELDGGTLLDVYGNTAGSWTIRRDWLEG